MIGMVRKWGKFLARRTASCQPGPDLRSMITSAGQSWMACQSAAPSATVSARAPAARTTFSMRTPKNRSVSRTATTGCAPLTIGQIPGLPLDAVRAHQLATDHVVLAGHLGIGEHGLQEDQLGIAGCAKIGGHVMYGAIVFAQPEGILVLLLPVCQVALAIQDAGQPGHAFR